MSEQQKAPELRAGGGGGQGALAATAVVASPRLRLQGYPPMAGPAGAQTPAQPDPNLTYPTTPGPYQTQIVSQPMVGGRTIATYDQGPGHPGAPVFFHQGLGARAGLSGVVGNSQQNVRALIVPPDRYRGQTYVRAYNVRTGRDRVTREPSRGNAGPVSKGQ
jgi:hypothetical protein